MTTCCWLQLRCATASDVQVALRDAAELLRGVGHTMFASDPPTTDVGLVAAAGDPVDRVRHAWNRLGVLTVSRWRVVSAPGCPACASSSAACSG